jgi:hypothetical protein
MYEDPANIEPKTSQQDQTCPPLIEEPKGPPGAEYAIEKENPNASKTFSMEVPKEKSYKLVIPEQDLPEYQYDSDEMLNQDHAKLYENLPKIAAEDLKREQEEEAQANMVNNNIKNLTHNLKCQYKKLASDNAKLLDKFFIPPTQQGITKELPLVEQSSTSTQYNIQSSTQSSSQSSTQYSEQSSTSSTLDNSDRYDDPIVRSSDKAFLYYSNDRIKLHKLKEQEEYLRLTNELYKVPRYVPKPSKIDEEEKVHPLFKHQSSYKIKFAFTIIVILMALLLAACLIYIAILYMKKKS